MPHREESKLNLYCTIISREQQQPQQSSSASPRKPLGGKPMVALCARHAVVKEASNAATVNFMGSTVVIGEHPRLTIGSLYKEKEYYVMSFHSIRNEKCR